MCGIILKTYRNKKISIDNINKSLKVLTARGPDKKVQFLINNVCLGQTILSFSRKVEQHSKKEHFFENNKGCVLLNGEIYNWRKLAIHYGIRVNSDIELISTLLKNYKIQDFYKKLEGMFAIVVYNSLSNEIICTRDLSGEKNLFIYNYDNELIIASTIEAILNSLDVKRLKLDRKILKSYFATRHLLIPESTVYKNISRIRPGNILTFNTQNFNFYQKSLGHLSDFVDEKSFYDINKFTNKEIIKFADNIFTKNSKELCCNINQDQVVSSIISGGTDSSLAYTYIENELKSRNIKNCPLGLIFPLKDEQAEELKIKSKIDFNLFYINKNEFKEHMLDAYNINLQPLGTHSFVSQYIVAKLAKSNFNTSVLFCGDGADELFTGYEKYRRYFKSYEKNSYKLSPYSEINFAHFPEIKYCNKDTSWLNEKIISQQKTWLDKFKTLEIKEAEILSNLMVDVSVELESTGLLCGDLMSSNHGLEARQFFMGKDIIMLALNLNMAHRVSEKGNLKILLRNLFKKHFGFPPLKKQGFSGYPEAGIELLKEFDNQDFSFTKNVLEYNIPNNINYDNNPFSWKILNIELFSKSLDLKGLSYDIVN